jgi:adenylate cyclase
MEPNPAPDLAGVLRALGVPEEAIERAVERGDQKGAIFEMVPARGAATRTATAVEIAAGGGMPVDCLAELMHALGLPMPAPDEPGFTPQEAAVLRELWQLRDIWPFELSIQLARVYGRLLSRLAHASVGLWVSVVEPRLRRAEPDDSARTLAAAAAFDGLLPVADALLVGVHRRWIEREAAQMAVREAELGSGPEGLGRAIETSFLFCDLKDFTAFADCEGDGAAIRLIDEFVAVVTQEQGPDARLTKLLGDGVMLVYGSPGPAVAAGRRIIESMRAPNLPGVHASVHHGPAIPREGDYFGSAVNLAARLLGAAQRDELVATRSVVERCDDLDWEPAGTHHVRGVEADVEVFRLRR